MATTKRRLNTKTGKIEFVDVAPPKPQPPRKQSWRFWPSKMMRTYASNMIKSQGLDKSNIDVKKSIRTHFQRLADMGKFNSPTSKALSLHGVNTKTWDSRSDGKFIWKPVPVEIAIPDIATIPRENPQDPIYIPEQLDLPIPKPQNPPRQEIMDKIIDTGDVTGHRKIHGVNKRTELKKLIRELKGEGKPEPTGNKWEGEYIDKRYNDITWCDPLPDARHDYFAWYNTFILNEDNCGKNYTELGKIHEEWCIHLEHSKKLGMLCPRDHFKTYLLNAGYILYHICEKQELIATKGIINISWDKMLAEETFFIVKKNLMENPRILSFYGYLIDEERPFTAQKMYFKYQPLGSRPGFFCTPIKGGRITGTHPYIAFLDDIEEDELKPAIMRRIRNIFNKKLLPAMGTTGRIIVTGTLKGWNKDNDAYLWLETKPTFEIRKYPAVNKMPPMSDVKWEVKEKPVINEETGKPVLLPDGEIKMERCFEVTHIENAEQYETIYPERYDIYGLVEKKLELRDEKGNDDEFNSEYLLKASDPAGRYFKKKRFAKFGAAGYGTPMEFVEHVKKRHGHIYLWIDPGGEEETSHGIAVSVMAAFKREYFLIDSRVIRKPIPEAAKDIGAMIMKWGVDRWGCEGNFQQKATYGRELEEKVFAYLEGKNYKYNQRISIKSNTGEKLKRISTHVSSLLGPDDVPVQFYVNENSPGIEDFREQRDHFGKKLTSANKHDFDILDCIASSKIHLFGLGRPFGISAR